MVDAICHSVYAQSQVVTKGWRMKQPALVRMAKLVLLPLYITYLHVYLLPSARSGSTRPDTDPALEMYISGGAIAS